MILPVMLLLLPAAVWSQNPYFASRTRTIGVRLDGGVSMSFGSSFSNVSTNMSTAVQPLGSTGCYFNFTPRFRAGVDYNYTRMARQWLDGTLAPLPGGGVQGDIYRDLNTHFHGVALTAEYNALGGLLGGVLSLYAGLGLGCQFAVGNTYAIAVKNEVKTGGTGNSISITGHNERHTYTTPFLPASVTLEYSILPQMAVSLGVGYRVVFAGKHDISPDGQAFARVGLRFNISNAGISLPVVEDVLQDMTDEVREIIISKQ